MTMFYLVQKHQVVFPFSPATQQQQQPPHLPAHRSYWPWTFQLLPAVSTSASQTFPQFSARSTQLSGFFFHVENMGCTDDSADVERAG